MQYLCQCLESVKLWTQNIIFAYVTDFKGFSIALRRRPMVDKCREFDELAEFPLRGVKEMPFCFSQVLAKPPEVRARDVIRGKVAINSFLCINFIRFPSFK